MKEFPGQSAICVKWSALGTCAATFCGGAVGAGLFEARGSLCADGCLAITVGGGGNFRNRNTNEEKILKIPDQIFNMNAQTKE